MCHSAITSLPGSRSEEVDHGTPSTHKGGSFSGNNFAVPHPGRVATTGTF